VVYEHRDFVEAGGLASYGPDLRDVFRRAAFYVDITGIANLSQGLEAKRLELLKEAVPRLMRVGILRCPDS
jgi:hypothetical protein